MGSGLIQFVYFNSRAWYGVRLAEKILKANSGGYDVVSVTPGQAVPATGQDVVLMSFLASREYPNIFKALDSLRIPYRSVDRTEAHPLIVVGGAAMFNPEPIADFVDVVFVGDGEEPLTYLLPTIAKHTTREDRIQAVAELPGSYVPSRRKMVYESDGFLVKDMTGETSTIIPHVTGQWMDAPAFKEQADEIELARGCNKSCFFCSITWRNPFRVRPEAETLAALAGNNKMAFFAPNTGGVPYYSKVHDFSNRSSKGDVTVDDFMPLPEPAPGELTGHTFTFGIEGISPRLRQLVGKPISWAKIDALQARLIAGGAHRQQLYFIRSIPGETVDDWNDVRAFIERWHPHWKEHAVSTELQFTPLQKQPHTPLQWFEHRYNDESEKIVMQLLEEGRSEEGGKVWVTPSRRAASWLIDTVVECGGRQAGTFLWSVHKGLLRELKQDSFVGRGYERVRGVALKCGIDMSAVLAERPLDARFPWSHISPMGDAGRIKREKAARAIQRMLASQSASI